MRIVTKLLKYSIFALAFMIIVGALYQWQAAQSDRAKFPPPGKLFLVEGLAMHLDCRGQGEPVVILEAGLTSGSSSWALVHDALSEVTQICAYDRPGMDWSAATDVPLSSTAVSRRLHQLLQVAGVSGPQILLGMSAGGVFVREYYARFPQDVLGMVLVDSSHEQQGARLPEIAGGNTFNTVLSLCSWLQPIGVVRALGMMEVLFEQYKLPEAMLPLALANANQSHTCASLLLESEGFQQEIFDPDPPASLGDLPLVVLSQGKAPEANEAFGITEEHSAKMAQVWDVLQNELTSLSTVGRRSIARRSGHVIQLEQPQIVIDSVTQLVMQLRNGTGHPTLE